MLSWKISTFEELSKSELYEILTLRQRVFGVEQNIVYLDTDGLDQKALHLMGLDTSGDQPKLAAYARIFPPNTKYPESSFGRVVTDSSYRGLGYGKILVQNALQLIGQTFGAVAVRISAQAYLEKFYQDFGFKTNGAPYIEEGIPHIEMLRQEKE